MSGKWLKDEKGVSPVIGVIMMVAITVVLAATIASFVFGMGSRIEPVKTPSFTVSRVNDTHVVITFTSKGGASTVENCNITEPSGAGVEDWDPDIGNTKYANVSPGSHLVMTCDVDGKKQVVLDVTV